MPRPEKVAKVDEIREKLSSADATVLTEYRGLTVTELATLRSSLRDAGARYKVYKNTLARRAAEDAGLTELIEMLEGPTAFAFVEGDVVGTAKALQEFSKTNDKLVVKGGLLNGALVSPAQVEELASLPSREELLAKIAGGFKAPLAKTAGLFSALQRKTAYAIKALIDQRVEGGEALPDEASDAVDDTVEAAATPTSSGDEPKSSEEAPAASTDEGASEGSDEPAAPEAGAGDAAAEATSEAEGEASPEAEEPAAEAATEASAEAAEASDDSTESTKEESPDE